MKKIFFATIFFSLILTIILKAFFIDIFTIPSASMESTLLKGDRIIVFKIFKIRNLPNHGDVIVFLNHSANKIFVKRCAGLPNDSILFLLGNIYINGKLIKFPLNGKPLYPHKNEQILIQPLGETSSSKGAYFKDTFLIYVPSKKYFMIGDNIEFSNDSRYWGFVPEENIIGKVVLVLFNYRNGRFRWDRFFKKIK